MKKEFLEILQNLTVLIAEDNTAQREKLEEIISLFTDKYISAVDGVEAYELYTKHKPNLIISDIKMPRMDGLSLVKKIRESDKKIPIIVLTAHTEKHLLLTAVPLYLNNYIVKPINEENLISTLKDVVGVIKENSLLEVKLQNGHRFNIIEKCIYSEDEKIKLTKKEILFLELLIKFKNQIVSKDKIEKTIWKDSVMTSAALKNFIFKIRKKIGSDSLSTSSSNGFTLHISR